MTFLESMEDLSTFISSQTVLEITKKICINLFGNAPIFSDPNSTLSECEQWLSKTRGNNQRYISFDFLLANVKEIYENFSDYEFLYGMLADDESKDVLFNILAHRLTRDDYYLLKAFSAGERQYFSPSFMMYKPKGVFVDCGALNGATTLEYVRHVPDFAHAYVYEPLPKMYKVCKDNLSVLESSKITIRQAAVSDRNGTLQFDPYIDGSSHISETGTLEVCAVCLDEDITEPVDLIKMDIEGAELAAIRGAERHIREDRPVLAISVYHLPTDLRIIPSMLLELCPNYKFYLRHHMTDTNETILYGFPCELKGVSVKTDNPNISQLADLLVEEYMHVQILQKDYFLYILKLLSDAREAHTFFETQYECEKERCGFFEQQFSSEKETRNFYEQQFCAEKDARVFYEQQFNTEKKAHEFFEKQYEAEKSVHEETKITLKSEKDAHEFFEQQFEAEKAAYEDAKNALVLERKAHEFFERQFNVEKEAHEFLEQQLTDAKETNNFLEKQYKVEKEAHTFFEQQYNLVSLDKEKLQKRAEKQEIDIQELENKLRVLQNENSKLNYRLQILKKDSLISKIIKFKKYEV